MRPESNTLEREGKESDIKHFEGKGVCVSERERERVRDSLTDIEEEKINCG